MVKLLNFFIHTLHNMHSSPEKTNKIKLKEKEKNSTKKK